MSTVAKLLFAAAGVLAAVVYWVALITIRSDMYVPVVVLGVVLLPACVLIASPIALFAIRLPKDLRLSCGCGWRHCFAIGTGRRGMRALRGQCIHCGYDLQANVSGVCPECGARIR